jgi:hypothetical protein
MSLGAPASQTARPGPADHEPWFRRRPAWTIAVAGGLFAAVFVLRLLEGDAADAYTMLYALPVALLATAFGRTVGTAAGALAVALGSGGATTPPSCSAQRSRRRRRSSPSSSARRR